MSADIEDDFLGKELNTQSLEMVEAFYLCNTTKAFDSVKTFDSARGEAFDSAKTKIESGWFKFRDLLPLLAKRRLISQERKRQIIFRVCIQRYFIWKRDLASERERYDKTRRMQGRLNGCAT